MLVRKYPSVQSQFDERFKSIITKIREKCKKEKKKKIFNLSPILSNVITRQGGYNVSKLKIYDLDRSNRYPAHL